MKKMGIGLLAAVALLGFGQQTFGALTLPTVAGTLLYQLDASDPGKVSVDGSGNVTSWAQSAGSWPCTMVPVSGSSGGWTLQPPTYQPTGGPLGKPTVNFQLTDNTVQKLVQSAGQAAIAPPRTVFIVENTTVARGCGGIWGRTDNDKGIRSWVDNPDGTHQLINYAIRGNNVTYEDMGVNTNGGNGMPQYYESYYWSDANLFDARQTWTPANYGVLSGTAYLGWASNWPGTSLGNYYNYGEGRNWGGQISEVILYQEILSDADRQAVESYLTAKWLVVPEPATMSLLALGGLAMLRRRRK